MNYESHDGSQFCSNMKMFFPLEPNRGKLRSTRRDRCSWAGARAHPRLGLIIVSSDLSPFPIAPCHEYCDCVSTRDSCHNLTGQDVERFWIRNDAHRPLQRHCSQMAHCTRILVEPEELDGIRSQYGGLWRWLCNNSCEMRCGVQRSGLHPIQSSFVGRVDHIKSRLSDAS